MISKQIHTHGGRDESEKSYPPEALSHPEFEKYARHFSELWLSKEEQILQHKLQATSARLNYSD